MKKLALLLIALPGLAWAQENGVAGNGVVLPAGWADDPPVLASLVEFARSESTLRTAVVRSAQDVAGLQRRSPVS